MCVCGLSAAYLKSLQNELLVIPVQNSPSLIQHGSAEITTQSKHNDYLEHFLQANRIIPCFSLFYMIN